MPRLCTRMPAKDCPLMRRFCTVFNENHTVAWYFASKPIVESNSYSYLKAVANIRIGPFAPARSWQSDASAATRSERY